jgi:pilus assembly protein Flp/PilA
MAWSRRLARFLRDEEGPTAVEYAVLLALIIVVCVATLSKLGKDVSVTFTNTGTAVGS